MEILIAIDDTDNEESMGTGRLARMLADNLTEKGLISCANVTRHQLLIHPDIPYTSHNSSACIEAVVTNSGMHEAGEAAKNFLLENFHKGANPGLCIANKHGLPADLHEFGYRAQKQVLEIREARKLAERFDLFIWMHGDTGQGCIGAMSAVGLRSGGNDGRFIGLDGIRNIRGLISVGELLGNTPIKKVTNVSGEILESDEIIDSCDWIRPSLSNGQAILVVKKGPECWITIEKKKRKKDRILNKNPNYKYRLPDK